MKSLHSNVDADSVSLRPFNRLLGDELGQGAQGNNSQSQGTA
jgi:hypothetical protein